MVKKSILEKYVSTIAPTNESDRLDWTKKTLLKLPKGLKILDAGAGELQFKKYCSHLKYTSQDFAQYNGKGNQVGLQMGTWDNSKLDIVSDITQIPRPDKSFDAILCTEVFEHLPDPISAIKEFSRLLKKGGKLIITAPFCSLTHFAPYHFHTGFNQFFYKKVLKENGFKIKSLIQNGNYFEYLAQELFRTPTIAGRYSKSKISIWGKLSLLCSIMVLKKISKKDTGSKDILCFGYFVVAERI